MSFLVKWGHHVARVFLGLIFLVFGLNFFLGFLGASPPAPERATAFFAGLFASSYVFPIIKTIEIAAGVALLTNRFVPLALTLLAPIIVNIAAVHLLLQPLYPMVALVLVPELYLVWRYRSACAPMLRACVDPVGAAAEAAGETNRSGTSANMKSA